MSITTIPRCICGSEMYAGSSGWVSPECQSRIRPFDQSIPKEAKRIVHDDELPNEAVRLAKDLKKRSRPGVLIELSGGIRPDNIERFARAGDIISLGWLTHSVKSIDFSMRLEPE